MTKILWILIVGAILRIVPIVYLDKYESLNRSSILGLFLSNQQSQSNIHQQVDIEIQNYLTDIDYKVYTDAAFYKSPYDRHTYRYTPLLSYMMVFNNKIFYAGKLFFVIADLIAIVFLYLIVKPQNLQQKHKLLIVKLYAFNPLFIELTVRGSCQSLAMMLMYMFCYLWYNKSNKPQGNNDNLLVKDQRALNLYQEAQKSSIMEFLSYIVFGVWVHFRVYPIVFIPFLVFEQYKTSKTFSKFLLKFIKFGLVSGSVFLVLLWCFYTIYGMKFIEQSYLYHLSRKDNRHSFAPYFYEIYLNLQNESIQRTLVRVLPQVFLIFTISRKLGLSAFMKFFLITYAFVCFNRVITMQYYMWIYAALLLILPESTIILKQQWRKAFGLSMQWVLGILMWVLLSMKLQHKGENVMTFMWGVCIAKLFSELWVLSGFIQTIKGSNYQPIPTMTQANSSKLKKNK